MVCLTRYLLSSRESIPGRWSWSMRDVFSCVKREKEIDTRSSAGLYLSSLEAMAA